MPEKPSGKMSKEEIAASFSRKPSGPWKITSNCPKHGNYTSKDQGKFGKIHNYSCPRCTEEQAANKAVDDLLEALKKASPEKVAELRSLLKS